MPLALTLWFSFLNYNLLSPGNVSFAGLFRTHPSTEERVRRLVEGDLQEEVESLTEATSAGIPGVISISAAKAY